MSVCRVKLRNPSHVAVTLECAGVCVCVCVCVCLKALIGSDRGLALAIEAWTVLWGDRFRRESS